ncbi:MAG: glycosyltransferase family 4 protein [Burkholderiaceae bacterium]|nr:glycosyltransferase family 4 protein [Burkholderiaceae bacterium]
MSKVLIVTDKPGWSYDTIAKGLVRYNNNDRLVLDIAAASDEMDFIEREHHRYDLIFPLGWTQIISKKKPLYEDLMPFVERRKLITGIHSHRSWDDYTSLPDFSPSPPAVLLDRLSRLRGVNTVSRRLHQIFERAGLTNIALTENGVDTELFSPKKPVNIDPRTPLVLGFSGSKDIPKHDYLKGFSEFIEPLSAIPNVQIMVLGNRGERQVQREDMPALYNQIDLYICASTSEGFSQSVLEASACGRGVLSTRVGGCEDLIQEGCNGFFIPRDLERIKTVVARLEADRGLVASLGENNRRVACDRYSWNTRVKDWLRFIELHLPLG